MEELLKIVLIILISSVKFAVAPPFANYFQPATDFSYFETVLICIIGGMLGVTMFSFFTRYIFLAWHYIKKFFIKISKPHELFTTPVADIPGKVEVHYLYIDRPSKNKKLFTPRNRRIVKIWSKYGLAGIAFLTPVIFSIPIGTVVATRLVHNKKKIFLYMFISIVFWSMTMNYIFEMTEKNKHPMESQELQLK